jgi:inhibitor of KinA sporulation pathway (predicted exonuclease)
VITCGDWDLKTMLPIQLSVSNIGEGDVPMVLKSWCNIKHVFSKFTGGRPLGMDGMLSALGLPLVGRHHRYVCYSYSIMYWES